MGKGKNLTNVEKQKITKLLREGNVPFVDIKGTLQRLSSGKEGR